jgi:hypothetical protein
LQKSDNANFDNFLMVNFQRKPNQEIESVDSEDYVITYILDIAGKELRKCRGCRVAKITGKNAAQDYGSALTYARRYSLLLAFGLATSDDDAAVLTAKPRAVKAKVTGNQSPPNESETFDRQAGLDTIKRLLDDGVLELLEIQNEVRKHGFNRMQDLPPDAFRACLATLTKRA